MQNFTDSVKKIWNWIVKFKWIWIALLYNAVGVLYYLYNHDYVWAVIQTCCYLLGNLLGYYFAIRLREHLDEAGK